MPAPVKGPPATVLQPQRHWQKRMSSGLRTLCQQALWCVQFVSAAELWSLKSLQAAVHMQWLPVLLLMQVCSTP